MIVSSHARGFARAPSNHPSSPVKTMKHPDTRIVLSSRDYARLESLLDALPTDSSAGKAALAAELDRAEVVEPDQVPPNVVTMNSTVRFTMTDSGKEFSLTLVYPKDAGQADRISVLAPVGTALLGLSVGDELEWPTPGGGATTVRVIDVVYQPERSGDLHR
jgi:regulator of nucleoside diphosphate kinase